VASVRVPDFPDLDWPFPEFDLPLLLPGVLSVRISPGYWHLQADASVTGLESPLLLLLLDFPALSGRLRESGGVELPRV